MRERTHWNSPNIRPRDPVLLGLCSQSELNLLVERALQALERAQKQASAKKAAKVAAAQKATAEATKKAAPEAAAPEAAAPETTAAEG